VEPEETVVARQQLDKQVSATTNTSCNNEGTVGSGVLYVVSVTLILGDINTDSWPSRLGEFRF
jgi:hypothetical protein